VRLCRHLPTFPRFLRHVQAIDVSTGSLFDENYARLCRELGGVPRDDVNLADRSELPPVHPLSERHRMPYQSLGEKFAGRVGAIWDLYDSLFRDSATVLQGTGVVAGTGGLGKTQLAIEYAHRFGAAYTGGVYWVEADLGVVAIVTQISAAAGIEVDTRAEEPEQIAQLVAWPPRLVLFLGARILQLLNQIGELNCNFGRSQIQLGESARMD
jgi:hypothetical protein